MTPSLHRQMASWRLR